jgi:NTE family protein
MGFFSWLLRKKTPAKIKVGLALGSGGAKGYAHLGVLKAFEENGIEFDIIAGTSIGSIIGGFYAGGYSATDIIELLKTVDLGEITNLFMMQMDTSGLYEVIKRELGDLEFSGLKKPFKAVATVLETGEEKVFDSGSVARALCASSSIPPFFKPVVIDGVRYIDGAYTNAIPADLVRQMGADYVVSVDLSTQGKLGVLKKLFPTYRSRVENPSSKGYENSDVMLHPDLNQFSSVSVGSGSFMYDIGYHHALSFIPKIKEDLQNLKNKKLKKR